MSVFIKKKNKIFILVNNSLFINQHLLPLIKLLSDKYELFILTSDVSKLSKSIKKKQLHLIDVKILREPSLFKDFKVLLFCLLLTIVNRPKYFLSYTPKAGFISSLIGFFKYFSKVKHVHYFTGQVWSTSKGIRKNIFMLIDIYILFICNKTFCDSRSQREFLRNSLPNFMQNYLPKVINYGSISGVDFFRFNKPTLSEKAIYRNKLNIDKNKFVMLFVGRINKEKGIKTLIEIFRNHLISFPNDILICVGPSEDQDLKRLLIKEKNIIYKGFVFKIEQYFRIADLLIFPSFREGFGSTAIEAAACGLPVIGSDIPGLRDSIIDKFNGFLINPYDVKEFNNSIRKLRYTKLHKEFSKNSVTFTKERFPENEVVNNFIKYFEKI